MEGLRGEKHILYLSRKDVEEIGLSLAEIIQIVEKSFKEKGLGTSVMEPKHWYELGGGKFCSAMSAYTPSFNVVGVKWQSGIPENPSRGLPYLNGYFIINNLENGLPIAILDSTWITGVRTGIQTAVTAKYLAKKESQTLAMIGCGVQGRSNLQALLAVLPKLEYVRAFDINENNLKAYVEYAETLGVKVILCKSQRDAISGSDMIVTAGPIHRNPSRDIEPSWLKEGVLAVPLDYDSYWQPNAINGFDKFFVDDIPQVLHLREQGSYFLDIPKIDGDLGEIIVGKKKGRENQTEKIMCMNLGVAIEDMPIAFEIYTRALDLGNGVWLRR